MKKNKNLSAKKWPKSVYFVGIKGVAMTALAIVLKEMGVNVFGSDLEEEFVTDSVLKRNKISWQVGFKKENIKNLKEKPSLVIVTGAHQGGKNPEALVAKDQGIKVLMHGEALGKVMSSFKQISVAGCHGKTTTAAMIAAILAKSGLDPSFAVGCGDIPALSNPGHFGKGDYFVAEADEYVTCPLTCKTPRFMWQTPTIAVFTNIEFDHPDVFKDIESVKKAFLGFARKIKDGGFLVACVDNKNLQDILKKIKVKTITYGFSPQADFCLKKVSFGRERTWFWADFRGVTLGPFTLQVPGKHNALNASGAILAANILGINWEKIKKGLTQFSGTKRRFELIGERNEILLYDDYAHHPTEILETLKAARDWFPQRRIIVTFQPHTFSRTKALFLEFACSFPQADIVLIPDIYPSARERQDPTINSQMLVEEINRKEGKKAVYVPGKRQVLSFLKENMAKGDIIFTMGAGDIFRWHQDILKQINSI